MSTDLPPEISARRVVLSFITLVGGVSLAVIPAATVAISSRIFTIEEQGAVAVATMVATFAGQITFAVVVESRLSSAGTERRVTFPAWLALLSVVCALVLAVFSQSAAALCIVLPVLVASLEVGRGVSVAEHLDVREMWAAIAVGLGALSGVLAAFAGQTWALIPLVAGIVAATIVRSLPVPHRASRPHPRVMAWVVTDVAVTGGVYPLLNVAVLALLGPVQAVLFTSISTVSGLLAIPLNFMRLRLLKNHSGLDILLSAGSVAIATIVIFVCEWLGVFGFLFGHAWSVSATALPLLMACLWRAASLATTIPFAALRRLGQAKRLTLLRGAVAIVTVVAALLAVGTDDLLWVFGVLLAGELLQAATYQLAYRRVTSAEAVAARGS